MHQVYHTPPPCAGGDARHADEVAAEHAVGLPARKGRDGLKHDAGALQKRLRKFHAGGENRVLYRLATVLCILQNRSQGRLDMRMPIWDNTQCFETLNLADNRVFKP